MSKVQLSFDGDVALLCLGEEGEKAIVLSQDRMVSLEETIKSLYSRSNLKGLVIYSPIISQFCAGADINVIGSVSSKEDGFRFADQGQRIFNLIEKLPFVTVCAIQGACVGGGFELALACKYRIATDISETKIGLPEVKLGIIPGFGGTQRLPRLIGIRRALDVIVGAKVVDAKTALKYGMIDHIVSARDSKERTYEDLVNYAIGIVKGFNQISGFKLKLQEKFLTHTFLGRKLVYPIIKKRVDHETKGFYPAPLKAIDSVFIGLKKGLELGYRFEAEAIGELIPTNQCKSLVRAFFLTENAKKIGKQHKHEVANKKIAIVGGGIMGSGIVTLFLKKGYKVTLLEPFEAAREKAKVKIAASLAQSKSLSDNEKNLALNNLFLTDQLEDLSDADLVIEAIVEDLDHKRDLFKKLSEIVSSEAILASNTSSLPIAKISEGMRGEDRFVGIHFFNPAEKMPLIEVIQSDQTSSKTLMLASAYSTMLGKYPIIVRDVPGFLINRILTPYLLEAGWLLTEGVKIEQIDRAAQKFGMPMGPLRLLDQIGLDVGFKVAEVLQEAYGDRMSISRVMSKMISLGRLGIKTGKGFYIHDSEGTRVDNSVYEELGLTPTDLPPISDDKILDRLILVMVNESVRCLGEGVAGNPGEDAIAQIDLGTIMGIGFPVFRGGIINFLSTAGVNNVVHRLNVLSEGGVDRLAPAEYMEELKAILEPIK